MIGVPCSLQPQPSRGLRGTFVAGTLLSIVAILLRVPPLLNAMDVNSDAAVVGLQAMHMLRGEWTWFLWGAGYQSALDSALTAAAFAVLGISPLVLMLVPLCGFLLVVWMALAVLRERVGLASAAACVLVLVVASPAINPVTVTPPRQWAIVLVFASVWLLDRASASRRSSARFALGTLCAALAVFVDLFALTFVPGVVLFAWLCVVGDTDDRATRLRRARACLVGAALGGGAVLIVRLAAQAPTGGALSMGTYHLRQRLVLLWDTCLPFSLGYNLYDDGAEKFTRALRAAPLPWYVLQLLAGWSLCVGIGAGGALFSTRRLPLAVRRLGVLGAVVAATTIAGWVVSTAPVDMWTVRYLGPIFWFAPFALAPVAVHLRARRFALAMAPYLIVMTIALWASYGFYVDGALPRHYAAERFDRQAPQLRDFLLSRGVRYAASDYWFAYRFSFVFREDPIIAPIELSQNRYDPYMRAFRAEPLKAWIFHPAWSRTPMEPCLGVLRERNIPFSRHRVGEFTVILFPDSQSSETATDQSFNSARDVVPALLY